MVVNIVKEAGIPDWGGRLALQVQKGFGTVYPTQANNAGKLLTTNGVATSWYSLAASDITTALTYTPVNKAGDTMTGELVLVAGSTTVGPLKFQSGTNLTTPVSGTLEYNGTSLFWTDSTPTRHQVPALETAQTWTAAQTFTKPIDATTLPRDHGVRVRADPTYAQGIVQFTDNSGSAQWAIILSPGANVLQFGAYTTSTTPIGVSSLPSASSAGAGARAFVNNANSTTFASIVAGGGTNGVPVYSDGTNWRIG